MLVAGPDYDRTSFRFVRGTSRRKRRHPGIEYVDIIDGKFAIVTIHPMAGDVLVLPAFMERWLCGGGAERWADRIAPVQNNS